MALDAASSSSSAPLIPPKKYDVFISFRGEDTRNNFISHLHEAFCRKQIESYIDYRLPKGDDISSALTKAIEDSYVSVVVFSKNYAFSRWCLEELTHILHCKRVQGQLVIPVFYRIDPTHVRHQTGTYLQAFRKHETDLKQNNKHRVCKWKAALKEVANLAGWDSLSLRDDSELIRKIVQDILQILDRHYPPTELKGLVGIDSNFLHIELLLRKVQTIGFWGMGGIGKSTIARIFFNKYSSQYEGCCFLENVRENSRNHGSGLCVLRHKLYSTLLGDKSICFGTSTTESSFLKRRLSRKKLFIVLDDVSSLEQLEYLALDGECHCFGVGSRIIITTRDRHVLSKGVDEIYRVKELKIQESLKLFNLNAFNQNLPIVGYEELSKSAVVYAKGVPLALKVLGSFLRGKSENEWISALRRLEKIPHEDIQKVLRLSYDGLNHEEKEIFLDIACFLNGRDKEDVISLLDSYGFYGAIGIRTLEDKALIIEINQLIEMHDLIREMGWEIVREESIKEPGRRSRLFDIDEVCHVLANDKGTDKIEGIKLDMSQIKDVHMCASGAFKNMSNLRFLEIYYSGNRRSCNLLLPRDFESLPHKIRYLKWCGYPLKSLPSTFCPEKLVEFHMPNSHIVELWDGMQDVVNLKIVNLAGSANLMELPDLSKAQNLKMVNLGHCTNLRHVHPSILSLHSLVKLILIECVNLESLKSEIHLRSLEYIEMLNCWKLNEFSVSSEKMRVLNFRRTGIEILHSSIMRSSKLQSLSLGGLRLKYLPHELSCLRSLEVLDLCNCELIDHLMLRILFDGLCSLTEVHLDNCCNIIELPHNTKHLSVLEYLSLQNCTRLRALPQLPQSIGYLDVSNCTSLEKVFTLRTCRLLNAYNKSISFDNCAKLDEQSLCSIMEDAHFSMKQAAYGHKLAKTSKSNVKFIGSRDCEFLLPGSRIPEWFRYRTRQECITIELPPTSRLLGFVFCISSQMPLVKECQATFTCKCYLGDRNMGETILEYCNLLPQGNLSNVHVWYFPSDCDEMLEEINRRIGNDQFVSSLKVSFKFSVEPKLIGVKECGVCPIFVSEYKNFIGLMKLKSKLEWNNKRPRDVNDLELRGFDEQGQEPLPPIQESEAEFEYTQAK